MTGSAASERIEAAPSPTVVYLDQNKWIDLMRAAQAPAEHPRDRQVLERLCAAVEAGRVRLPLTSSNLYETHKVDGSLLRAAIAYTQVTLSRAHVFRGRRRRLEVEVSRILAEIYSVPWTEPEAGWVFSRLFFEAQAEFDDPRLGLNISDRALHHFRENPEAALFDYLAVIDDGVRRQAVGTFEQGLVRLKADIEERRARHRGESLSMRRKIYSVLLALGDQEFMIDAAVKLGLPWRCFMDNNGATMRRVVRETPTLLIEREISLKLEGQRGDIKINDALDMQNFTTVLPYADIVVAENGFINLARQAGLAERFHVRLETDLGALLNSL